MITYSSDSSCIESWTEKSRDIGTISVEESYVSGDKACSNGLWQVVVNGNTLVARPASVSSDIQTHTMTLHKVG